MRGCAWLTAACLAASAVSLQAPPRLDIVHIVVDDAGYNDMGFLDNSRGLIAPNMQKWADEGIKLTDFHVQPICSPTRSALMTGAYPIRLGTHGNVIYWNTPWCLPSSKERAWIPERLKRAGYGRTAMYGKSHMGSAWPGCLPTARGFDDFNGYLQGCGNYKTHQAAQCTIPVNPLPPSGDDDQFPPPDGQYDGYDWFSGTEINITANGTYSEWLVQDRAIDFLGSIANERARGRGDAPFYLYLPFQNIHTPLEVQDRYRRMYPSLQHDGEMQTLSGMITAVDDAIGAVLAKLNSTGLSDNTLVWLHSDNGAPPTADKMRKPSYTAVRNFPLRGWKTQVWEGGTRVPSFVWAPPHILKDRAGTVSDQLIHVTDIAPTLVEGIAGGSMDGPKSPDGFNQLEALLSGGSSARDEMLYNINPLCDAGQAGMPKAAVRQGSLKLLCDCWDQRTMACTGSKRLYNLTADVSETTDLAKSRPDDVDRLEARLVHYASDMLEPMQWVPPYQGPDYFCADCPLGNQSEPYHAWRPFLKTPDPWPALPALPPGASAHSSQ